MIFTEHLKSPTFYVYNNVEERNCGRCQLMQEIIENI